MSNKVGVDDVTVSAGSVGLPVADVGTNAFTSTNGLVLGGSTAGNYTLTGVSGSVIVTQAVNLPALTSSLNPSAYRAGVNFTATPAPLTPPAPFNSSPTIFCSTPKG